MTLETLKDIDVILIGRYLPDREIIEQAFNAARTEAIKWVKSDKSKLIEEWEKSLDGKKSQTPGFVCFADFCIMKMNNITSEDLKDGNK